MSNILILSSLDPQGSAGISADILSVHNNAGFALPIVTNLTAQNTKQVFAINPVETHILYKQFDALIEDCTIDVVKIGLLSPQNLPVILHILKTLKKKVVLDPIIQASTGDNLGNLNTIRALLNNTFLITPNAYELEQLTSESNQQKAVEHLALPYVLITQTDNSLDIITHKLFKKNQLIKEFYYKKLAENYHGSGCVLSSSIAAKLNDLTVVKACESGLEYTYQTLIHAKKIGKMQASPNHINQYHML